MKPLSLYQIAKAIGADTGRTKDQTVLHISTDSRKLLPKSVFIALKGENFDGHDYIGQALDSGAIAVICEKKDETAKGVRLFVKSTEQALLSLASYYRGQFRIPVIGVTGSVGKTTTKEMIACVLSASYPVHKNEGNFNNQVGMPMSVFGIMPEHHAAIFEMGMSALGEISALSKVASPQVAVITNIGAAHMESLGSAENIRKAKLEILDGMRENGILLVNGDDPMLKNISYSPVISYGFGESCEYRILENRRVGTGTEFDLLYRNQTVRIWVPAIGAHQVYNAAAAFACGILLGLNPQDCVRGLRGYEPAGMRQRVEKFAGITLIEDCYNASPDSMQAALQTLSMVAARKGKKIAVLGNMLELGEKSKEAHQKVGETAAQMGVQILYAYGSEAVHYAERAKKNGVDCRCFTKAGLLVEDLLQTIQEGDTVLVKGSRGMHMEEIIAQIRGERA